MKIRVVGPGRDSPATSKMHESGVWPQIPRAKSGKAPPNSPPDSDSLNDAEKDKKYWGRNAYRCIARKQARQTRAGSHNNNVYQERELAPGPVTKVAENEGTEQACGVPGCIGQVGEHCQRTVESTFEQPEIAESSFLFWQRSEVRHQVRYIVGLNLRSESGHLPFALGDYFAQRLIALLLNTPRSADPWRGAPCRTDCLRCRWLSDKGHSSFCKAWRHRIGLALPRWERYETQDAWRDEAQKNLFA